MWTQIATVRGRLNISGTGKDTYIRKYINTATVQVKNKIEPMLGEETMPSPSALLASTTATATMTLTANLATGNLGRKVRVRVKDGTANTGTVTIVNGTTTEGLAESEILTFTGSATVYSTKLYTTLTLTNGITTTGLADEESVPTVEVWGEIPQELRNIVADLAVAYYNIDYNIDLASDAADAGPKAMIDGALKRLDRFIKNTYISPNRSTNVPDYRRCAP